MCFAKFYCLMLPVISSLLNNSILRGVTRDGLLAMDPEQAHKATLLALKAGLVPKSEKSDPHELQINLAGLKLSNPVGMAAGFDKNAEVHGPLGDIGFGLTEVGTITPRPQLGNPKPRLFRLMQANGVINRMGFNNEGHDTAYKRLVKNRSKAMVGVNIGANKTSEDFVADYVLGVQRFAEIADYLTINISSPNTPGLRGLQSPDQLKRLLGECLDARDQQSVRVPVFLKIAPDLDKKALDDIAQIISKTDLEGLIVSNTTLSRKGVEGLHHAEEVGGLSGAPLFDLSTIRLAQMRQRVGPDLAIIGVGGIHSARSALAKIEAGANAIQLYTALVFGGMELLDEIKTGLYRAVQKAEKKTISELVGTKVDQWAAQEFPKS